jgi:hypothetical protein
MKSDAYKEGYDYCGHHGPNFQANPYPKGSQEAEDWRDGVWRCVNEDDAEHRGRGG